MTETETKLFNTIIEGPTDARSLAQAAGISVEVLAELPPDSGLYAAMENVGRLMDAATNLRRRDAGPLTIARLEHLAQAENTPAPVAAAACKQLLTTPENALLSTSSVQVAILQDAPVLADFTERFHRRLEAAGAIQA